MGTLLHSCVEVHEPIEQSFGMVSMIRSGIRMLGGATCCKGKGTGLGSFRRVFPPLLLLRPFYGSLDFVRDYPTRVSSLPER